MTDDATIVHISDLHFGNESAVWTSVEMASTLTTFLQGLPANRYLIISGDVTYRGNINGYTDCKQALLKLIDSGAVDRKKIILCPGNHDLCPEPCGNRTLKGFRSFDEWSSAIRNDNRLLFSEKSAVVLETDHFSFLCVNTSHHFNHEFGLIDMKDVEACISTLALSDSKNKKRVAVAHHHFIPILKTDTSTVRNAYHCLELLIKHDFCLLTHGHQHAMLQMQIGSNSLMISGVGSYGFNQPRYINSFATYTVSDTQSITVERYGLTADVSNNVVRIHPRQIQPPVSA